MGTYIVSIIVLTFFRRELFVYGQMEKPGKCTPWIGGAGPCIAECTQDWSCSGLQKCCSVGCGKMCQNPCSTTCDNVRCNQGGECKVINDCAQCVPTSGKNEKIGTCLVFNGPNNNRSNSCLNQCQNDFDCFGNMKCCTMGCRKICQNVCSRTCNYPCNSNSDCKIVDGCAQCIPFPTTPAQIITIQTVAKVVPVVPAQVVTVALTTVKPTTRVTVKGEKPGNCLKWQGNGPCVTNCNADVDCPDDRKCCAVGCGKMCQDPCPTVCDWECFDGKQCQVVDGCAQCIGSDSGLPAAPPQSQVTTVLTTTADTPTTLTVTVTDPSMVSTTIKPMTFATHMIPSVAVNTHTELPVNTQGQVTEPTSKHKHKKKKKQHPRLRPLL